MAYPLCRAEEVRCSPSVDGKPGERTTPNGCNQLFTPSSIVSNRAASMSVSCDVLWESVPMSNDAGAMI
jgi:hypothetical protein